AAGLLVSPAFAAPTTPTAPPATQHDTHATAASLQPAQEAVELRIAMRKLWEDHITYTRNAIISILADLSDQQAVSERLLKNQQDIGDAIKPYYGNDAGGKLTALLREHILIAVDVVKAAKAGNKAELDNQQKKWSANGKNIAALLSTANPNWSRPTLEGMLQ